MFPLANANEINHLIARQLYLPRPRLSGRPGGQFMQIKGLSLFRYSGTPKTSSLHLEKQFLGQEGDRGAKFRRNTKTRVVSESEAEFF
jgi:hypothetical protein